VITATGLAVAAGSEGGDDGVPVGAAVASGTGAIVGTCDGSVVGDTVVATGASDGASESTGTSVGDCAKGASPQISLPPITSLGVISEQFRPFCEGYPEFANVLPATNSSRAVIPSSSTQAPQPLMSWQLAVREVEREKEV
jgi:hypothetical protein